MKQGFEIGADKEQSDTRNLIETSMIFICSGRAWLFHRQTNKLNNCLSLINLICEFVFGYSTDKKKK